MFYSQSNFGQNIQWIPSTLEWYAMRSFLGIHNLSLPSLFQDETYGLYPGASFGNPQVQTSYEDAVPWRLFTLASDSGGVHMHQDDVPLGAWQLQVKGAKTWYFCPPTETMYLGKDGDVDAFSPDLESKPEFAMATCYKDSVRL